MKIGRNEKCPCGSNKKLKYCHISWQTNIPLNIPLLKSEKFIITLDHLERQSKLFQIRFENDGSLYVDFPYFKDSHGMASQIMLDPSMKYPTDISLLDNGKITSHLVKYSHHPDGEAHFSQDGKVKTEIRKKAVPLTEADGHIFTVMLQGENGFDEVRNQKDRAGIPEKRHIVKIKIPESEKHKGGIKFIGWLYPKKGLKFDVNGKFTGLPPIIQMKVEDRFLPGVLLSGPQGKEHILFLTCELIPLMNNGKSCLTFLGGFDCPKIGHNPNLPTSFLALAYPIDNPESLIGKIASIDLNEIRKI